MPQLDKVTFLSQFFWLCLFYLGFYYIVLKYFLPKISRILALRQKKMNLSQDGFHSLQQENQQVRENLDNTIYRGLSLSRNVFNDFYSRTNNWLDESLTSINKTQYKTVNNSYIHSLGEASLSQNVMLYQASSEKPEYLKVNKILDTVTKLRKIPVTASSASQKNPSITTTKPGKENNKKSKKNKKDTK